MVRRLVWAADWLWRFYKVEGTILNPTSHILAGFQCRECLVNKPILGLVKIHVQKVFNAKLYSGVHVVEVKANAYLLAIAVVAILIVTIVPSGVTAQNSTDENNDDWGSNGPIATIYGMNATTSQLVELKEWCHTIFLADTGNFTLKIRVDGPREVYKTGMQDPLNWQLNYLTSVSYQASWRNNNETQVYTNTTDNQTKTFDFELTNIPYGNNTLQIDTSYVVTVFGPPYETLKLSKGTAYFFIVAPNTPAPTVTPKASVPENFSLEKIALLTLLITVIVAILVSYKRKRHANLPLAITSVMVA